MQLFIFALQLKKKKLSYFFRINAILQKKSEQ